MPRLFALDQNFPQLLIRAASPYFQGVELEPIWRIDPRLAELDDWELLLALHHHKRPFDGLITTDDSMLNQPRELEIVRQTSLTLVVVKESGHDPIKATGLLLAHLDSVCSQTTSARPQVWELTARKRAGQDPSEFIERVANHQNRSPEDVLSEVRLTKADLDRDPLNG